MKKLIIFDLDGVIIDSKENMRVSWKAVNKSLNLKISFKRYFDKIGMPFEDILKKLRINRMFFKKAKKIFRENSIKNFNLIKTYPETHKIIGKLKKNPAYKLAVLTSKEKTRTIKILKRFNLKFHYVQCPIKGKKGKPDPYLLNNLLRKSKVKKSNCCYLGDTSIDLKFSKNSKINFIFCNYGYGKIKKKNIKKINKLSQVFKFI